MKDSNVISQGLFDQLMAKIPARHSPDQPPIGPIDGSSSHENEKQMVPSSQGGPVSAPPPAYNNNNNNNNNSNNGGPQRDVAEAMYNYQPNGPTDLPLYPGLRVEITERLNNDWWRGKDMNTQQEGIFPANYVKVVQEKSGGYGGYDNNRGNNNTYYPPPQQQQQYNNNNYYPPPQQQQQPFPPASTSYYQPPAQQQPQQQQVEQVQQQQPPAEGSGGHHNAIADGAKKFGGKLGNAAIFGAGATIGSNIVNSIF